VDLLLHLCFTSELCGVRRISSRAGLFTRGERVGDDEVIGGCVVCRAIPDIVEKR
jgi:hypothetical protein